MLSLNGPVSDVIGSFFDIGLLSVFGTTADLAWGIVRAILVTAFVALLAYYSVKMMGLARGRRGLGNGNLNVVESIMVGQQSMVQLVRAGEKYLVIGVTRERVTLLAELDEISEPEEPEVPFSSILNRFIQPKDESDKGEDE